MSLVYYNVSLNGWLLFSTEEMQSFDVPEALEGTLTSKFTAAEGYKVRKAISPAVWTVSDLPNGGPGVPHA